MKKRILFSSNFSLAHTGFGKAQKEVMSRLYKTGKYELCELAAGISDGDSNVARVPWQVIGVLPKNNEENHRFNSGDENLKRAYQYGLFRFDEAIERFKPHIIVGHEDIWQWAGWLKQSKYYGKFIHVQWGPLDAEPLCEEFSVFLKDFKYIYTYGEWSKGIAVKAGIPQTKIITLGVNNEIFKPLEAIPRNLLRFKHNILEKDFVVLMVARNQIRKKFDALFESLNHIKTLNPELYQRIKIIPFSNYTDQAGIFFPKFWKSRDIDASKIITPYVCTSCRAYHISQRYEGEEKKCPDCGADKSCHTPSVVDGFSDEQLNEVYNISDMFILPTSNEGFGQPLVEALGAGKIIVSTDYSTCREIVEKSEAGFLIPSVKYCEYGTLFVKANIESPQVAKVINKVYQLDTKKRWEMEKKARQSAIAHYNWDTIAKQWEVELDGMEPLVVDWNSKPIVKHANPNAEIGQNPDNFQWILELYKKLLDCDISEETKGKPQEHDGVKYWLFMLDGKQSREDVEKQFRGIAQKDYADQNKVSLLDLLDPNDAKRLLFVMPRSFGDNFLTTSVVDELKVKYPEHNIYVACEEAFKDAWKNNPNIKKCLPFVQEMLQYGWGTDRFSTGPFHIVLTPTMLTQMGNVNWGHSGRTKSYLIT